MPIDIIGQVIGLVGGAIQAPQRAAEARAEQQRLEAQQRLAALELQRDQLRKRQILMLAGVGVAGVVAFMLVSD